ncbi:MAG: hypothetical protein IJ242_13130 [Clostridia bacterium]|nr:hypothetical protein [Clostridia bacterium]
MKCPNCGAWNQAYLPKCTKCGAILEANTSSTAEWEDAMHKKKPSLRITSFDEKDSTESIPDQSRLEPEGPYDPEALDNAVLADEMEELKRRRERGRQRLEQMRQHAENIHRQFEETEVVRPVPEEGDSSYSPDPVSIRNRQQDRIHAYEGNEQKTDPSDRDATGRFLAFDDQNESAPIYYDGYEPENDPNESQTFYPPRRVEIRKQNTDYQVYDQKDTKQKTILKRILNIVLTLVICAVVAIGGVLLARHYVFSKGMQLRGDNDTTYTVEVSEVEGFPSHKITFYGRENATVYIQEMQTTYVIADGSLTINVPDYMWYDTESSTYATAVDTDTMDVTVTPFVRYQQEGAQYQLEPINFTIDVPLSPIYLINPPTAYAEVGVSIYEVRINVEKGSTVIIDGTNVSTLIRDTGNVSKNVQVLPVGENTISISVKSKYCREHVTEIVLYRAPQDIPLELNPTVIVEWNYEKDNEQYRASISGTTLPGAEITIESDHDSLEVNSTTGEFKFRPIFTKLGNNEVIIRASYPGRNDSVITHTVYYMPTADVYTRKAWDLDGQYSDLINYINMRIGTIYVAKGVIKRIISTAPQLAIMDIGTTDFEKLVLLENSSKTTWAIGTRYRIYGEAYGLYGSMPRLTVRYTYLDE